MIDGLVASSVPSRVVTNLSAVDAWCQCSGYRDVDEPSNNWSVHLGSLKMGSKATELS